MSATPRAQRSSSKPQASAGAVSKTPTATTATRAAVVVPAFSRGGTKQQQPFDSRSSFEKLEKKLRELEVVEAGDKNTAAAETNRHSSAVPSSPSSSSSPPRDETGGAAVVAASSARTTTQSQPPTTTQQQPRGPAPPPPSSSARNSRFNRTSTTNNNGRPQTQQLPQQQQQSKRTTSNNSARRASTASSSSSAAAASDADERASIVSGVSASATANSARRRAAAASAVLDTGAVRKLAPPRTAAERMAALDRLARQVGKMELSGGAGVDDRASVLAKENQQPAASATTKNGEEKDDESNDDAQQKLQSSPSPSWRQQQQNANTKNSVLADEETYPWPEPTAAENEVMSLPRGKMERNGTGQFIYSFPDSGYWACRRCHRKIAGAKCKIAAEGGYAAFSEYCAENLRCDILVLRDLTTVAVSCISCLCNIGKLHPVLAHLMVNSASLVHCTLTAGKEFAKRDTRFSDFALRGASEDDDGEEDDDDDETERLADKNSVLM